MSCGSLFFRLGSLPLSGADEPRYARIAEEMDESRDWITPALEGRPWLEKPPLYYWMTAPFYSVFDSPEVAARAGSALCALLAALTLFWLGAVVHSTRAGLLAATVLLTSLGWVGFGRSASTDMPFTACFTVGMAILGSALRLNLGWKSLAGYLFIGLAVLGKGPVALILAAGIVLFTWFVNERGDTLRKWHVGSGWIVTAAVAVPWFWLAFRENGFAFISIFFVNHNIARYVTDIHHHAQPFYYYLPVVLGLLFPWTGWLALLIGASPLTQFRKWRSWDPVKVFLTSWFLVPMIFFSLSGAKLPGYVLPSLPPLALLAAMRLDSLIEAPSAQRHRRLSLFLHSGLSGAMAVAAAISFGALYQAWGAGLILAGAILLPGLFSFRCGLRGDWRKAVIATAVQGLVIVMATAQFAFPVLGAHMSTREIAHRTLEQRTPGEPIVTYRFFHHSLNYYTGYQVVDQITDPEALKKFVEERPNCLVVTNEKGSAQIDGINGIAAHLLARQAKFRLLRLTKD